MAGLFAGDLGSVPEQEGGIGCDLIFCLGALMFQFRLKELAGPVIRVVMTAVMHIAVVATAIAAGPYNQTRNTTESRAKFSLVDHLRRILPAHSRLPA